MRILCNICCFIAVLWAVFQWVTNPTIHTPPGVLVPEEPVQEECPAHVIARVKDYTITALATYAIRARVLHTKHYWAEQNDLVPYDVALGWGRMSDQAVLDHLEISQGNRFYFYEYQKAPPIPEKEIDHHSANNHLIAANSSVKHAIGSLYPGQIVTMHGYLVNVSRPDGFSWNTSLTRNDTGNGACEVFYVEDIKAEMPGAPVVAETPMPGS